jgi:hypothetical protein
LALYFIRPIFLSHSRPFHQNYKQHSDDSVHHIYVVIIVVLASMKGRAQQCVSILPPPMANIFRRIRFRDSHSSASNSIPIPESENALLPTPIEVQIVSAPPILVGFPNNAQGVPISGQLKLRLIAQCSRMVFTQIRLSVVQITKIKTASVAIKSPYKGHRATATSNVTIPKISREQTEELAQWNAPTSACVLCLDQNAEQRASFDFILQIPGHVPATTDTAIGSISYVLIATATVDESRTLQTRSSLPVQRAIPCSNPALEDTFLRRYHDTRLRSKLAVPAVIDPTGPFPVNLLFWGLAATGKSISSRLAIRECKWRIDETTRIVSISSPELGRSGVQTHQEMGHYVRRLAGGKCGERWTRDGDSTSCDFEIKLPKSANTSSPVPLCLEPPTQRVISDIADASNSPKTEILVSHVLVLEFAMMEELFDNKTGKRVNLDSWRMSVYGSNNLIFVAHRTVGYRTEGQALDNSELLPSYSDFSSGGPPAYQRT